MNGIDVYNSRGRTDYERLRFSSDEDVFGWAGERGIRRSKDPAFWHIWLSEDGQKIKCYRSRKRRKVGNEVGTFASYSSQEAEWQMTPCGLEFVDDFVRNSEVATDARYGAGRDDYGKVENNVAQSRGFFGKLFRGFI